MGFCLFLHKLSHVQIESILIKDIAGGLRREAEAICNEINHQDS